MLKHFVTRVQHVQALQLTEENLRSAAALCGAWLDTDRNGKHMFILDVGKAEQAHQVIGRPGAWLVKNQRGWIVMKDTKFRHYYQRTKNQEAADEVEIVPPYDR